jgi:hypothetical protein
MKKSKWSKIECDHCGKLLNSEWDLFIWNSTRQKDGTVHIDEASYRHGNDNGCDDKSFLKSVHMKDNFDDILELIRNQEASK